MKKKYISPKVDIINTRLESELLAGTKIEGGVDHGTKAKTYDFGLDDFSDESMWRDEIDVNK